MQSYDELHTLLLIFAIVYEGALRRWILNGSFTVLAFIKSAIVNIGFGHISKFMHQYRSFGLPCSEYRFS